MQTDTKLFIDKLNQALAKGDIDYVIDHVTDDIRVTMIGGPVFEGKDANRKLLNELYGQGGVKRTVTNVITQGAWAVVEGETQIPDRAARRKPWPFATCID